MAIRAGASGAKPVVSASVRSLARVSSVAQRFSIAFIVSVGAGTRCAASQAKGLAGVSASVTSRRSSSCQGKSGPQAMATPAAPVSNRTDRARKGRLRADMDHRG
ncbi:hypothetical protein AZA_89785 [Nitrospirillum viridazoti Y2]|nr:hypothetical protein AZA_89785 [Nitrospirillum amazonense Y2]